MTSYLTRIAASAVSLLTIGPRVTLMVLVGLQARRQQSEEDVDLANDSILDGEDPFLGRVCSAAHPDAHEHRDAHLLLTPTMEHQHFARAHPAVCDSRCELAKVGEA